MWIVMVSVKGGYKAHSIHDNEETAKEWARCVEYGGQDTAVCFVDMEAMDSIKELTERTK